MDPPILFSPTTHTHLISQLVSIHTECILQPPYVIATFIPPLSTPKMQQWWEDRVAEVVAGNRQIILQMAPKANEGDEQEIAGYVSLGKPITETGPFRGAVEKLLVHPKYRGLGIARRVMAKLEEVALAEGRGLLMLDTTKGSPAEFIYPRLGYTKCGEVPLNGISPFNGELVGAVLFYKDLRPGM